MNQSLVSLLNDSAYHYFFLIVDPFLSFEPPLGFKNITLLFARNCPGYQNGKRRGDSVFCLESSLINNSGGLLAAASVQQYITDVCSKLEKNAAIIPFKPSAKVEKICRDRQWCYVASPAHINRLLEDKIKFYNLARGYHLPVVPSLITTFTQTNIDSAINNFKTNLVVQSHFGWAGKSTFKASSWVEIKDKLPLDTPVKISPFLPGYAVTNNCCLTSQGFLYSLPALQLTGIPTLTTNPFTTVGRQWPALTTPLQNSQIADISYQCSRLLAEYKFKGFFGLDFLITGSQIMLLECNARLTASFDFLSLIHI